MSSLCVCVCVCVCVCMCVCLLFHSMVVVALCVQAAKRLRGQVSSLERTVQQLEAQLAAAVAVSSGLQVRDLPYPWLR